LTFSGDLPVRRQQNDFIAEIARFIRDRRDELGSEDRVFMSWEFSSPLMRDHLHGLHLRVCPYAVWYPSLAAGFVGMPDSLISQTVAAKSKKQYRQADELWLAIQSSTKISELLLTLDGVADFERVPSLDGFRFSQVLYWPTMASIGGNAARAGTDWVSLTRQRQSRESALYRIVADAVQELLSRLSRTCRHDTLPQRQFLDY
jgi:hypothetical protein